jgi:hypothetical protein
MKRLLMIAALTASGMFAGEAQAEHHHTRFPILRRTAQVATAPVRLLRHRAAERCEHCRK